VSYERRRENKQILSARYFLAEREREEERIGCLVLLLAFSLLWEYGREKNLIKI